MEIPAIKQIRNEKNVTKKDILDEANKIWEECQQIWNGIKPIEKKTGGKKKHTVKHTVKQISQSDYKILDSMYEKIRDEHRELMEAYPTVLRHMVQEMNYSPQVFSEYLDKLEKNPYINDETRMDSYTDYAVMLYKHHNSGKHLNITELNAFKRDYRARLQKEHDEFMKDAEEYKKNMDAKLKQIDKIKRANLLDAFIRLAEILKVEQDQINNVKELVETGVMLTEYLEKLVFDFRKIYAGETPKVD